MSGGEEEAGSRESEPGTEEGIVPHGTRARGKSLNRNASPHCLEITLRGRHIAHVFIRLSMCCTKKKSLNIQKQKEEEKEVKTLTSPTQRQRFVDILLHSCLCIDQLAGHFNVILTSFSLRHKYSSHQGILLKAIAVFALHTLI